jgi:cytochrome c peroxidase
MRKIGDFAEVSFQRRWRVRKGGLEMEEVREEVSRGHHPQEAPLNIPTKFVRNTTYQFNLGRSTSRIHQARTPLEPTIDRIHRTRKEYNITT